MLLDSVPPSEACRPPAPKGRMDSELEKKKRRGNLVLAAAKFAILVGGELVVGVIAGAAGDKGSRVEADEAGVRIDCDTRGAGQRRIEEAAGGCAELVALEIEERFR